MSERTYAVESNLSRFLLTADDANALSIELSSTFEQNLWVKSFFRAVPHSMMYLFAFVVIFVFWPIVTLLSPVVHPINAIRIISTVTRTMHSSASGFPDFVVFIPDHIYRRDVEVLKIFLPRFPTSSGLF